MCPALVETAELVAREPQLAASLATRNANSIEQEELVPGQSLEEQLAAITWPETVHGCAALVERFGAAAALERAARRRRLGGGVRLGAPRPAGGADRRRGDAHRRVVLCPRPRRAHDEDTSVVTGAELVPELVDLVRATLEEETA